MPRALSARNGRLWCGRGAYFNFDDLEDQRLFVPEKTKLLTDTADYQILATGSILPSLNIYFNI